ELQLEIDGALEAARDAGREIPFDRMRRTLGLTRTEERALWVLIAVEVSSRLRQLMRYLVNEASRIHADVGLLELLVYSSTQTRDLMINELSPDGRLTRHRLIEPIGTRRQQEDAPFLLRPLKANPRLIELVHGVVRLDREVADLAILVPMPPGHDRLVLPDELKAEVTELLRNALAGAGVGVPAPAIVLSGAEGAGRKSLVYGAAAGLGCSVLHILCERLPSDAGELVRVSRALVREAILFRAVPLLDNVDALAADGDIGRPERSGLVDRALDGFVGPVAATCARRDSRPIGMARGMVMVDVPVPGEAARAELWRRALGADGAQLDFDRAAGRYPVTGGLILRASESALARAHSRGEPVNDEDVHTGLRSTLDVKLSTLGVRVTWRQGWDDLVLPDDSLQEIREFIARVRHRRRVYEEWGFARKMAKGLGLSALFAGPPGTGKTMVAGIIADELGLDLYQIDLSRIVSKYVGETEKNLAQVFD
ncbi:MAG TPA: ATP-binding protein, partial [Planctomycetota bacterium]|nr:ATP-binding protein [Planctomycetota bacterium]